jgi:hypothetical protein
MREEQGRRRIEAGRVPSKTSKANIRRSGKSERKERLVSVMDASLYRPSIH